MMPISLRYSQVLQRKLFQYRNLPYKFSYACQNQWFGNETSVSHDQPPLGVVREYVCTYLGINSLHYSEVWLGVQPHRLFRPLLQACRVRGSSRYTSMNLLQVKGQKSPDLPGLASIGSRAQVWVCTRAEWGRVAQEPGDEFPNVMKGAKLACISMPTVRVWNTSTHFGLLAYCILKLVEDILFINYSTRIHCRTAGKQETFEGKNFRKFRGFVAIAKVFSTKLGVWHPLAAQASNSQKFFSGNIVFSHQFTKYFSLKNSMTCSCYILFRC